MKYQITLLLLLTILLISFSSPVKRKLGVLMMERRNASSSIKWENVESGDTLHYNKYSSIDYKEESPRYLMYSFQPFKENKTSPDNFMLDVTYYKQKDSVAFCQIRSLSPGMPYVCDQPQLDVTSLRIRIMDKEEYIYTVIVLLDGNMNANKRPYAYYEY